MAHPAEYMRGAAMRAKHSMILTQAVSLIAPMWYLATMGRPKGRTELLPKQENWRGDIEWDDGGDGKTWNVVKTRSTATHNTDPLRFADFEETDLLFTARVSRYNVERTWAVSSGDLDENKNDDTRLADIRKVRRQDAQDAVMARLMDIPWHASETNQNGGLTMFSPTSVAGAVPYAGISMSASYDGVFPWRPTGLDYGASTIAANFLEIFDGLRRQLQVSRSAGGGGGIVSPDFAVFSPASWAELVKFITAKMQLNIYSGDKPQNWNMFQAGFDNVEILGCTLFPDQLFGGSRGYIDAVAAEEFLMGHSAQIKLSHTASKKQGFIRAEPTIGPNAEVSGELGKYKTGKFCLYYKSPKFFQVAYT